MPGRFRGMAWGVGVRLGEGGAARLHGSTAGCGWHKQATGRFKGKKKTGGRKKKEIRPLILYQAEKID